MTNYNIKEAIVSHYETVSPYYHSLWGEHLHHGYWKTGTETKEEAQLALTRHLAEAANITNGSKILDVGCGFGASSIYLAKEYEAKVTGITNSPLQIKMAQEASKKAEVNVDFQLMDADALSLRDAYDVIWSIESISHYRDKELFFNRAVKLLSSKSMFAVIDWFKKENMSSRDESKYILPIEKGMMVQLHTMEDYISYLQSNGLNILRREDLSSHTVKTWDISLEIIKNKALWQMAYKNGKEFVNFLRSFRAMKNGYVSGNFVYGLIIARKP